MSTDRNTIARAHLIQFSLCVNNIFSLSTFGKWTYPFVQRIKSLENPKEWFWGKKISLLWDEHQSTQAIIIINKQNFFRKLMLNNFLSTVLTTFFKVYCFVLNIKFRSSNDRGLFDQKSVDWNCHFSFDQNFHNQLTEIFDTFQLIEWLFPNLTWPNLT